ncbi:MAM domain-containing glycosylphosphatidylinositol anchor protein 2 isoform X1 [Tribolium castaneum]|uniref:Down syndrome cell adhesion molecule-like protein Dscam2 n=1 Tax=Tribolium castaneum TaxID=7070 RepID=D6WVT0_TRICA|nr:PREDICTED: MAM domain-containing glycosylphosphatidylinositol anchor protein 2 [Tribolium castaneum]EFA08611.1 Down syndrome cell adhesion molecule-like protein Dscam2 [Tribolium castaneum]|eukprot:XP_969204.1 PREDICTED: MAM domain-containing glycosylphosphatidylinositol anchor protein 2 [Tribolium castaneum]
MRVSNFFLILLVNLGEICVAILNSGPSYRNGGDILPRFASQPNTFSAVIGDTIVLPCEVQNLGSFVIVWKRGITLLTAGQQKITADPRISLVGYNLEVRDIRYSDQGDYTCQIGDGSHGDLIHTVEILMPPSIQIFPNNGDVLTTRKGATVSFECRASGNPTPVVQWSKKEGLLPSGLQVQTGYLLSLTNVQREDAGAYQCTASNGIGQAVTGEIKLHVLFPPEITVAKSWVNSGEGLEARLDCVVQADPPGEVSWYQNSFPLQQTDRRIMSSKGKIYTLTIKNVQFSDFGNYSCTVHNSIGKDRKYIELTGKPGPARIISPAYSNPDYYDLRWVVQSVLPIIEVKILYRRINATTFYDHKGQWHDLVIKPEQKYDAKTSERLQSFRITNLVPDSLYECLILTKNQHGYSDVSDVHQWFSSDKGRPFVGSTGQIHCLGIAVMILLQIPNVLL